jgi:hypothetical protein
MVLRSSVSTATVPAYDARCPGAPADEHCFWRIGSADDVCHECKVRPCGGGIEGLARVRLRVRGRPCDPGLPENVFRTEAWTDPR